MRHILRYRGKGRPPSGDVERIRDAFGAKVVEQNEKGRLWLIEASASDVKALGHMTDWSVEPELGLSLPRDPSDS